MVSLWVPQSPLIAGLVCELPGCTGSGIVHHAQHMGSMRSAVADMCWCICHERGLSDGSLDTVGDVVQVVNDSPRGR